jgi:hypothetical protein
MSEEQFAIVDLRLKWRSDPYITLWRPENAGYAYPLPWAGRYSAETLAEAPGYYWCKRYPSERVLDRWPVPFSVVERLAVPPAPGRIDGDAGPVLRNDGRTRRALRRHRLAAPATSKGEDASRG